MKFKICITDKIEKDVEIDFPIYRRHDFNNTSIFMRVDSLDSQISINIQDDKIEMEIDKPNFYGGINYLLGLGEHSSSKEQFDEAIKRAQELLNKIK